jgi:hypothetical protein
MKLTKNIISRDEALKICPDYVAYMEGDYDKYDVVSAAFNNIRKGQKAIAGIRGDGKKVTFVLVKVTSVNHDDFRAVDGPVVRVGNDEYTWRVDGSGWAWPL